jgi:hypothetical protein
MADNMSVTPGRGATIATDEISGKHYQRVKVGVGADGQATDLAFGQGDKAHSLPVTIASNDDLQIKMGATDESAPANDTSLSGLNGRLQRIAQRLTSVIGLLPTALGQGTMAQSLRVVLPSDQSTLPVNQATAAYDVTTSFSRPADATPYTAKDVVGATAAALTFASVGAPSATIMITGAELEIDISAIPSGMTSFRLHFYNVTPPSALADNAAFDLVSGDRAAYLGFIELGSPELFGSTLYASAENVNKQVKLSTANLYGYLVTAGAYTPNSGAVYKITLHTQAV